MLRIRAHHPLMTCYEGPDSVKCPVPRAVSQQLKSILRNLTRNRNMNPSSIDACHRHRRPKKAALFGVHQLDDALAASAGLNQTVELLLAHHSEPGIVLENRSVVCDECVRRLMCGYPFGVITQLPERVYASSENTARTIRNVRGNSTDSVQIGVSGWVGRWMPREENFERRG
jgi:hypothetical protein